MTNSLIRFAIVSAGIVAALVLPTAAHAQQVKEVEVVNFPDSAPPARFQLVGFTSELRTGASGVLNFTLACQAEFPGSRMCTSVEVMETTNVPAGLPPRAWVRPVFEVSTFTERDSSGATRTFGNLGCQG